MNHHHRNRLVATICGLALLAAGCGSSESSTTSAPAETSTPSLTYAV